MASSSIEIMILGALIERPMSAYEMDRVLEERNVRRWIRISSPSVYRNVIRLCEQGVHRGHRRQGRRDARRRRCTRSRTRGASGSQRSWTRRRRCPRASISASSPFLANISLVDEQTGRALIDELIETHLSTADRVDAMIPSYERLEASSTMELCAATYRLVAEHLEHFKEELYPAS